MKHQENVSFRLKTLCLGQKNSEKNICFPLKKLFFLPSVEKTTIFSSGNKSLLQSFSVPGIMFPPRRNIYSFVHPFSCWIWILEKKAVYTTKKAPKKKRMCILEVLAINLKVILWNICQHIWITGCQLQAWLFEKQEMCIESEFLKNNVFTCKNYIFDILHTKEDFFDKRWGRSKN